MDPASFAFATIGLVGTVINAYSAIAKLVHDVKNFDGDREQLIARIKAEEAITLRLQMLLFTIPSGSATTPFEQLDGKAQQGLYAIFTLFAKAVDNYLSLDERYSLSGGTPATGKTQISMIRDVDRGEAGLQQTQVAIIRNVNRGKPDLQQMLKKGVRPILWGIWDKKKVTNFVQETEMWNKKITQIVKLHMLSQQVRDLVSNPAGKPSIDLLPSNEARDLGIQDALAAQAKALTLPSLDGNASGSDQTFEQNWTELKNARKPNSHWNIEIGRFNEHIVMIDSKLYDGRPSKKEKEVAKAHLNQLASVLQNLHRLEESIPECLGWMNRLDKGAYSLLFQIPPSLEPRPQSLYDALPETSLSAGPLLDKRFETAYCLAATIDSLHSVCWVHRNIRSENILLFYTKSSMNSAAEESADSRLLPPKWFLYGFEYARNIDAETSSKSDTDPARNIYRHPRRWGVPTVTFGPIHDIYALGVVLLELGMWRRATSIVKSQGTRPLDPFRVRADLVERASKNLGYTAGAAYRDAVLRCLKGDFGIQVEEGYEGSRQLSAKFRELVVDQLRILAFPNIDAGRQISLATWETEEPPVESE
jgi:hypothetical protein